MELLYGSKFYKASPRKDKIIAAMQNPVNMELVQQLKSYLSDDTLREISVVEKPEEPSDTVKKVDTEDDVRKVSKGGGAPTHFGGGGSHFSGGAMDDVIDDFNSGEPTQLDDEATIDEPEGDVTVEDEGVESATDVDDVVRVVNDRLSECDENIQDGVIRVTPKHDNEVWIYFNDETNLNTVMTPVIDKFEDILQFNRLARSNNAIVFESDMSPIKTVDGVNMNVNTVQETK